MPRWQKHDRKLTDLGGIPLLRGCSRRELLALAAELDEVVLGPGQVLDTRTSGFLLAAGSADVVVDGVPVGVVGAGAPVLDLLHRHAVVVVRRSARAYVVPARRVRDLVALCPGLSRALLDLLIAGDEPVPALAPV